MLMCGAQTRVLINFHILYPSPPKPTVFQQKRNKVQFFLGHFLVYRPSLIRVIMNSMLKVIKNNSNLGVNCSDSDTG